VLCAYSGIPQCCCKDNIVYSQEQIDRMTEVRGTFILPLSGFRPFVSILVNKKREKGNLRRLVMDLLFRNGGLRRKEIGCLFGVGYSAVSQERKRLRRSEKEDREIEELKWRLKEKFSTKEIRLPGARIAAFAAMTNGTIQPSARGASCGCKHFCLPPP